MKVKEIRQLNFRKKIVSELIKRFCISFVILLSGVLNTTGQNAQFNHVSISSPTAASLGKYADFPVNYHTGLPQISVPIYTIKNGALDVPISLSYHAGGLQVMEQASMVGAGWSLNAGGVITRTVKGGPDDRGLGAAYTKSGYFHDYGYNNYLFTGGGPEYCGALGPPCPVGASQAANDQHIANTVEDGEPDLYFFNFSGHTGKFYFRDDRTPILLPQQDLKIEPILADESGSVAYIYMLGFVVTTPDGTKYFFGKNQEQDGNIDAIEKTTSINTRTTTITNHGVVSSWFLTKIESFDGQFSIKFTYQPEKSSYYTIAMYPIWNFDPNYSPGGWSNTREHEITKNFIDGVRLNQVLFSNGTITLNPGITRNDLGDFTAKVMADDPNTTAKSLGSISISDNNGVCKKYTFHQSYFYDNVSPQSGYSLFPIESDKYRLRLDSIQESSCDNSLKLPSQKFSYYAERVPRKLSFGQDHWGFFNGKTNNSLLIPTYFLNGVPVEGADRDAYWPAMRGGALEKITYPTGGFTQFDYEPHDTYGTITTRESEHLTSISVGYDGSNNNSKTFDFPTGFFQVNLSNANSGSASNLSVRNASNVLVQSLSANPGETKTAYFNLTAGTYTLHLNKGTTTTGNGATAQFIEWKTITSQKNIMVGGLRIQRIMSNDAMTTTNIVKNYTYTTGGTQSSGILYSRPVYVSLIRNDIVKQIGPTWSTATCSPDGCAACNGSTLYPYYKSGSSILPLGTTQGNHIGYEQVKVEQAGNGYSIYRYYGSDIWATINSDIVTRTINTTVCDPAVPTFPLKPLPFEFKRGELKFEGHFNQAGQSLKEIYYYPTYVQETMPTPGYIVTAFGGPSNPYWGTEYELYSSRKTRMDITTFEMDPLSGNSLSVTTREYYGSLFHNKPTRQVKLLPTGDSLITNLKYAADFRIANCDNIADGSQSYFTAYNAATTTFYNSLSCVPQGSTNCRWVAYQQYKYDRSVARTNYINYRRTNFTDPTNAFKTCFANAKSTAGAELKPIVELQDNYYNAAIETTNWKNTNLLSAVFVRFDYATNPATKIYPSKIQTIQLPVPSPGFAQSTVNGSSITKDSRYTDESFYKFHKGNLVELKQRDGIITSYIWGYKNIYPVAKITGTPYSTAASYINDAIVDNPADDQQLHTELNKIRTGLTNPAAQVHTYSYKPLSGITREQDPDNRTTYYEYDNLFRLLRVRDENQYIVKQFNYQYQAPSHADPIWETTGATRCKACPGDGAYIINILQREEKDTNPQSTTFNQLRWTDAGSSGNCVIVANWQNTGTVQCLTDGNGYRTGIQRVQQKDLNPCSPTYNNFRDQDASNTTACPPNAPNWQNTGTTQCKPCPGNGAYITNMLQQQQRDNNVNSSTYNNTRWVDAGVSGSCVIVADWQNTATAIRCKKNGSNQNTGEQEREQKDMNPCSIPPNQIRWVVTGTNTTACPLPGVYAEIVLENYQYGFGVATADVTVYFYADAAHTIPATVNNLIVNYSIQHTTNGTPVSTSSHSQTCNGQSFVLDAAAIVYMDYPEWEPPQYENYNYYLTAGTGYVLP